MATAAPANTARVMNKSMPKSPRSLSRDFDARYGVGTGVVGITVGNLVGAGDGTKVVGDWEGAADGMKDGDTDGTLVGGSDGTGDGLADGV